MVSSRTPMPLIAEHHRYPAILPRVRIKRKPDASAPGQPAP
jgi:hypothetical protein